MRKYTALERLSTEEEIANTIYAVSHLMTAMTGQYVVVDSGQSKSFQFLKDSTVL